MVPEGWVLSRVKGRGGVESGAGWEGKWEASPRRVPDLGIPTQQAQMTHSAEPGASPATAQSQQYSY